MKLFFEPDYRQKILHISFEENSVIQSADDIQLMRFQWLDALKSWHSPYKAFIDCKNLTIPNPTTEITSSFKTMMSLLNGFFLKKAVGYHFDAERGHHILPFPVLNSREEAAKEIGIRELKQADPSDFRSYILLDNHFQQHTIELSFAAPVCIDTSEKVAVLKQKLMNNLMHWHSGWNLLVDCQNVQFSENVRPLMHNLETFFKGFFLKNIVGYNAFSGKENYPFLTFKARHKAAAALEAEGAFSGAEANCKSRKQPFK